MENIIMLITSSCIHHTHRRSHKCIKYNMYVRHRSINNVHLTFITTQCYTHTSSIFLMLLREKFKGQIYVKSLDFSATFSKKFRFRGFLSPSNTSRNFFYTGTVLKLNFTLYEMCNSRPVLTQVIIKKKKKKKKTETVSGRIRTCAGKAHMISSHAR